MIREDIMASMQDPEIPYEYGFHYSSRIGEIRNAVMALELFNQWPEEGGYFDQDANLVSDMMRYKALYNSIRQQYKRDDNAN